MRIKYYTDDFNITLTLQMWYLARNITVSMHLHMTLIVQHDIDISNELGSLNATIVDHVSSWLLIEPHYIKVTKVCSVVLYCYMILDCSPTSRRLGKTVYVSLHHSHESSYTVCCSFACVNLACRYLPPSPKLRHVRDTDKRPDTMQVNATASKYCLHPGLDRPPCPSHACASNPRCYSLLKASVL